jgi:chromate transporter
MSERESVDLFAIARAAPGPGELLATLVGWKVAGQMETLTTPRAAFLPAATTNAQNQPGLSL